MTARPAQRPCDCFDRCGDDPALAKGLAAQCERGQAMDRELAELGERVKLEPVLAREAAVARLRMGALVERKDGDEWFALAQAPAPLTQAARYLVLTSQALAHPTVPHLVRLTPTPRSAL